MIDQFTSNYNSEKSPMDTYRRLTTALPALNHDITNSRLNLQLNRHNVNSREKQRNRRKVLRRILGQAEPKHRRRALRGRLHDLLPYARPQAWQRGSQADADGFQKGAMITPITGSSMFWLD